MLHGAVQADFLCSIYSCNHIRTLIRGVHTIMIILYTIYYILYTIYAIYYIHTVMIILLPSLHQGDLPAIIISLCTSLYLSTTSCIVLLYTMYMLHVLCILVCVFSIYSSVFFSIFSTYVFKSLSHMISSGYYSFISMVDSTNIAAQSGRNLVVPMRG